MSDRSALLSFDLTSAVPLMTMSDNVFDCYLMSLGLLWATRHCQNCSEPMRITTQAGGKRIKFECMKRACRFSGKMYKVGFLKGTFFEKSKLSRRTLFVLSYLWVNDVGGTSFQATTLGMSRLGTVTQCHQYFRDICVEYYTESGRQIGGPGTTVTIDGTCVIKRHRKKELPRSEWLIGGVQRGTRKTFIQLAANGNPDTLLQTIKKNVIPGTTIVTHDCREYSILGSHGFDHVVKPKANFTDVISEAHMQDFEGLWSDLKRKIKHRCGLKGKLWDDVFYERLWKFEMGTEGRFKKFWDLVAEKYPCS